MQIPRLLLTMAWSVAVSAWAVSSTSAAGSSLNLGKLTDTTSANPYFQLDNFRRVARSPSAGSPLPVLFFTGPYFDPDAAESWPVVKSLQQFGTLTGVRPASAFCVTEPGIPAHQIPPPSGPVCVTPGLDFTAARLRSRWVSLVFRTLNRVDGPKITCSAAHLSARDWSIFARYAHPVPRKRTEFCRAVNSTKKSSYYHADSPLLIIGDYAQGGSQIVTPGDFGEALAPVPGSKQFGPISGLPFATIQADLIAGRNPPHDALVEDVNAETNIITAFICHGDGMRPKSACGRSVIKSILKHVK